MNWPSYLSGSRAVFWQRVYRFQYVIIDFARQRSTLIIVGCLSLGILVSAIYHGELRVLMEDNLLAYGSFENFRNLMLAIGSALLGASAIAFSLVMFAMQVNVDRMPHGVFRALNSDLRLLLAFVSTFVIAIAIATLSLIPGSSWLGVATLVSVWGTILVLCLFVFAYRRALALISPVKQLQFLVEDTNKDLREWLRRFDRAKPLLGTVENADSNSSAVGGSTHDINRIAFFRFYPNWLDLVKQNISHCIYFARRYSEQNDHEVARTALDGVVLINRAYVHVKGKTFFTSNSPFGESDSTDAVINDTLEHVRKSVGASLSRGDEQQTEQCFSVLTKLCSLYANIDYAQEISNKSHAHLAVAYLGNAVDSALPHNFTDVVMAGVRLLGQCAGTILAQDNSIYVIEPAERIGKIACVGALHERYRPVTQVAVDQLARLTVALLQSSIADTRHTLESVRKEIQLIAEIYMDVPNPPLVRIQGTALGPYYSCTSSESLTVWLGQLCNSVSESGESDERAQLIVQNIVAWSDELSRTERGLLILALDKRLSFSLDLISWITHVVNVLVVMSNSPACNPYYCEALRRNAISLLYVFSWVPDDREVIIFADRFTLTDSLINVAFDVHNRDCAEVMEESNNQLKNWAFKAGKYPECWAIFEKSLYGLATLELLQERDGSVLLSEISKRLSQDNAPSSEIRNQVATLIRSSPSQRYRHSRLESHMQSVDAKALKLLLGRIADELFVNSN